jgi:hypothetical protein
MYRQMMTAGLLASVSMLGLAATAEAQTNNVRNNQNNWAQTRAQLNADINSVSESVSLTSAAISNSFSAELGGVTTLNNVQRADNNASASAYINAHDALGGLNATVATIGNSASIEVDALGASGLSTVNNDQRAVWNRQFHSHLTIDASDIQAPDASDVAIDGTVASIANSLSVTGSGNMEATNFQHFHGDVQSFLNADLNNVTGSVNFTSAAIANSASYDIGDSSQFSLTNTQWANYDPQAWSNVNVGDINGDFSSTTAAISNSLSVSTLPETASLNINSQQMNNAYTGATANIQLGDVTGAVSLTTAAIGNSVSINNLPR